ncbi:MAG: alpha/beta fold hydrolase [Streptosporangiales bacterium]|nr:alpha/beta fold hydrolase [Streptosporangiales bacterium]
MGLLTAAAGMAVAGVAVGVATQRYAVERVRRRSDPAAGELFGLLRGRPLTVRADDGVPLHVEVRDRSDVGDVGADRTIVFCHGFALHQGCWHYQMRDLTDLGRLVFWDLRSHGRSGRGSRERSTVDQLGKDLYAVLQATAPPEGPVVLVGHSMGGMSIMALADQHPELFGRQVRGVGLICTSSGRLAEVTFGLPALSAWTVRRMTSGVLDVLGRRSKLVEPGRRLGRDLGLPLVRHYGFSQEGVSPSLVRFVNEMIAGTPVDVVADFYPALMSHDKLTALASLLPDETLVVAGENDRFAPVDHSRAISAAVPGARLCVVPDAGHLVMLEWPEIVNEALRELVAETSRVPAREKPSR